MGQSPFAVRKTDARPYDARDYLGVNNQKRKFCRWHCHRNPLRRRHLAPAIRFVEHVGGPAFHGAGRSVASEKRSSERSFRRPRSKVGPTPGRM
jgi:hypothetical protein